MGVISSGDELSALICRRRKNVAKLAGRTQALFEEKFEKGTYCCLLTIYQYDALPILILPTRIRAKNFRQSNVMKPNELMNINRPNEDASSVHTWSKISIRFPLSLSTISTMEGLLFLSASTHFSAIKMHAFTCWRPFASNNGYLYIICSSVFQFSCT